MMGSGISTLQQLSGACAGATELVTPDGSCPLAALRDGADDWARALRQAGIGRGDRVVSMLPNGAAFVQLLLATMAEGITFVPVSPRTPDTHSLLATFDASLVVCESSAERHVVAPGVGGGAPSTALTKRDSTARTDGIAFLLGTSGTTGAPVRVALSDANVVAVLDSHRPHLQLNGAVCLSVLPWHHVFGLVLDLLPALHGGNRIVAVPESQRDASHVIDIGEHRGATHLSMVPLLASDLARTTTGHALLHRLHGGIIGGAPIDDHLSTHLTGTQLRVGYGQTEASPGIMLGARGAFHAGILGQPVGCTVRIDADGELAFRGANACAGFWSNGTLVRADPDRWQRTGDLVTVHDGEYTFIGRSAATFKLANGRSVVAPPIEASIRARCPAVSGLLLSSPTPREIRLYYSTADSQPIDDDIVRAVLGGLARYYAGSMRVPAEAWVRTSKGLVDRRTPPDSAERTPA